MDAGESGHAAATQMDKGTLMIDIRFGDVMSTEVFIRNLDSRLQDQRRFWMDSVAPFIYSEIDDIFHTGGRGTWADLDPIYAARKAVTHPGKGILRSDDTYYKAATTPRHPGSLLEVSPTALGVGVRGAYFESTFGANYPGLHEEGDPETNLSARPVYELIVAGERFEERLGQLGEKWVDAEIAHAATETRR